MNPYEAYMKEISQPMRDELTNAGFTELTTPEEVDTFISETKGTSLVVINSVCGCAAGLARPSARESLNNEKRPENLVTVFAGQDREATSRMRDYLEGYEPSSPSMALLKDGQVLHFIPREEIEDYEVEEIVANLTNAYNQYC
ncbi:putative bacilliredoxin, YphP/YqiW family [Halobacillus karajensis]|uniref:Bacillithiol system oxidoreductase, YphP/YqiW family n=1 Tax=Halobacillus karajensis TaxID=195088 RepID=A0A024P8F6_9BACI|nr:BrxA/BrxB family bacilliredoxin [Halobacillus karajensis]CDQ21474.1 bacillithiol system oxidoreductase, YphP/YqiW family [Halobacillus karajensis]CDQ25409.1 bacillithiol system oxidoreductase, YphP/YqiW family [Halobacillus karajensis]CDQ29733.1 bacillithiol system oxidoreductase, YphP/YqiW family [Halobacillus karajensis]SEI08041.1 putative bacilliredoxin, YphP/YqiW family [Halobacillus karajensis]